MRSVLQAASYPAAFGASAKCYETDKHICIHQAIACVTNVCVMAAARSVGGISMMTMAWQPLFFFCTSATRHYNLSHCKLGRSQGWHSLTGASQRASSHEERIRETGTLLLLWATSWQVTWRTQKTWLILAGVIPKSVAEWKLASENMFLLVLCDMPHKPDVWKS